MARLKRYGILLGLTIGTASTGLVPAEAFTLFGYRLWGEEEEDDRVDVIDPLPYTATINVHTGSDALERSIERASSLWTDRDTPASGTAGLISKARGDYRRILTALYAEGYYGGEISIRIGTREAADMTLAETIPPNVPIRIAVHPGPQFTFGRTEFINGPPFGETRAEDRVDTPASVGFVPGDIARSGAINQASTLAIEQWRQLSRAKARETGRDIVANHPATQLDVALTFDPGPRARYGPLRVSGNERMDAGFIAYMTDLPVGGDFDPDDIRAAEDRLGRLGVFSSIRLEEAEEIGPDGSLPFTLHVEERRLRTIGAGATYSTLDGLGISAYAMHRNLFGSAERLRFDLTVARIGETSDALDLDYNVALSFVKPGVITPDTNFGASIVALQAEYDTYDEQSVTARAGLSHEFGGWLTGEAWLEAKRARYEDDFGIRRFTTFGAVLNAQYDRRDSQLEPTEGYYLAANLRPTYEFYYGNPFLRGTLEGRGYLGFGEDRRFVLAGRALVGSFLGPSVKESPPDQLFFAGGGGSIRGYAYQSIGVETTDAEGRSITQGGKGIVEGSVEARARLWGNFGGVAFVDGGVVTQDSNLAGADDLRFGAGVGVRYYTRFGPLRVDVATPIDPRPQDDDIALYIGIGQAF
jgi:translocation and assembly module TamA